jgi:hypothetical protein
LVFLVYNGQTKREREGGGGERERGERERGLTIILRGSGKPIIKVGSSPAGGIHPKRLTFNLRILLT